MNLFIPRPDSIQNFAKTSIVLVYGNLFYLSTHEYIEHSTVIGIRKLYSEYMGTVLVKTSPLGVPTYLFSRIIPKIFKICNPSLICHVYWEEELLFLSVHYICVHKHTHLHIHLCKLCCHPRERRAFLIISR